jgi:hypothetical protein
MLRGSAIAGASPSPGSGSSPAHLSLHKLGRSPRDRPAQVPWVMTSCRTRKSLVAGSVSQRHVKIGSGPHFGMVSTLGSLPQPADPTPFGVRASQPCSERAGQPSSLHHRGRPGVPAPPATALPLASSWPSSTAPSSRAGSRSSTSIRPEAKPASYTGTVHGCSGEIEAAHLRRVNGANLPFCRSPADVACPASGPVGPRQLFPGHLDGPLA